MVTQNNLNASICFLIGLSLAIVVLLINLQYNFNERCFKENKVPQPDKIKTDDVDFSAPAEQDAPPGLYVSVTDGEVTLQSDNSTQKQVIKKGQAAFTDINGVQVKALSVIPTFQKLDVFPTPNNFEPKPIIAGGGD